MAKSLKQKKTPLIPPGHIHLPQEEEAGEPELTPEEKLDIIPDEEEEIPDTAPDEKPEPGEGP